MPYSNFTSQTEITLKKLHQLANAQQNLSKAGLPDHERFMAISPEQGDFLYFLVTLTSAKNIVEFGCSFGVSTIYLAAAASHTGGGVTTTEMESAKWEPALQHIEQAGLRSFVHLLKGNAIETLLSVSEPVDFLFLDGAKHLYLPVFKLLEDKIASGAVIFADNTDKKETWPLLDYFNSNPERFVTSGLFSGRSVVAHVK